MIIILSLNTAVDRIEVVPGFRSGHVYRAERSLVYAGGKGLNVARVVRRLGHPVQVVGFLGGAPERFIRAACATLGIEQRWIKIERETRTCIILVDPEAGTQTVVNEPGPTIDAANVERLLAVLCRSTREGDLLCISGSAPPGVVETLYAGIVGEMRSRGVRVLVDVSGTSLAGCWSERPWALSPNYEESVAAFSIGDSPESVARHLATRSEHVLLTLGAEGVIYASGEQVWQMRSPPTHSINAVGSGDAFAAGFLVGISRGYEPLDAVRLGGACGASNASRLEPDIGPPEEIEQLMTEARTETL